MTTVELITTIKSLLELGMSVADVAQRVCDEHSGYTIPNIDEFDKETRELANRPNLVK